LVATVLGTYLQQSVCSEYVVMFLKIHRVDIMLNVSNTHTHTHTHRQAHMLRDIRTLMEVTDMFITLTVLWVYAYVQTHQIVLTKYVYLKISIVSQ
jgi:hypothetical protein